MIKQPVRTSLSDFIKSHMGSQFVIPVYQRIYTWSSEKETARFMNDLSDLLKTNHQHHFLGIIIYFETKMNPMLQEIQIVDGQQRLTTTFIFLLALRDYARHCRQKEYADWIEDYYIFNHRYRGNDILRLKPEVSSDDVFSKLVYGTTNDLSPKEKKSKIYQNYQYILKRIQTMCSTYSISDILNALSCMDILAFPLSEDDNAQQIYESINSTGAPLTSADLIRNYILMNHPNQMQERLYQLYWQPLEIMFEERTALEEFFRWFLTIRTNTLLNRRDIYEVFKMYWNRDERSVNDKLSDINSYARCYQEMFHGTFEDEDIEKLLVDYRNNDSAHVTIPFMMELDHLYQNDVITKQSLMKVIAFFDSYLMRRNLCRLDNAPLSQTLPALLKHFQGQKKVDAYRIVQEQLLRPNKGRFLDQPSDETLRTCMRESNAYSLSCLKTVFERIEHHGASARVDIRDLNIEHIMPQSGNDYWYEMAKTDDEEEYTSLVNLIGNLTLASYDDNSKMGNQDFTYKKKILSQTLHIRMNTSVLKQKHWNREDIMKRCDELTNQLIRIYPYYSVKSNQKTVRKKRTRTKDVYTLSSRTASATAIVHGTNDVEVLEGAVLKTYGPMDMKRLKKISDQLVEKGILQEADEEHMFFARNYFFPSLDVAGQFLLHRGGNNTNRWKKADES